MKIVDVATSFVNHVEEEVRGQIDSVAEAVTALPARLLERIDNARQLPSIQRLLLAIDVFGLRQARGEPAKPDPTLSPLVPDAEYVAVSGELFGADGPKLADVAQGQIGDCYFLAAVGSLVTEDPRAIQDMIHDNGDGTYSVRFYHDGMPVWIGVDADLPVNADGTLVYAAGVDSDGDHKLELWVPLVEKAYAKYCDRFDLDPAREGYGEIDSSGFSDLAMTAITGKSAQRNTYPASAEHMVELLEATNDEQLVVVGTQPSAADGWEAAHAYTVVGSYELNGETLVIMRNPWGWGIPNAATPDARDPAMFTISADELFEVVRRVYVGEAPDPVNVSALSDRLPSSGLLRTVQG